MYAISTLFGVSDVCDGRGGDHEDFTNLGCSMYAALLALLPTRLEISIGMFHA
jgi:hypothetical protein